MTSTLTTPQAEVAKEAYHRQPLSFTLSSRIRLYKLAQRLHTSHELRIELPPEVVKILQLINKTSPAYLAGGFVRDYLLGIKDFHDIDVCVEDAEKVFSESGLDFKPTGTEFGVMSVFAGDYRVDVVQLRSEMYRDDSRKPMVKTTTDVFLDLSRRDLTVNAIAVKLGNFFESAIGGSLIDPFHGSRDLAKGILRMVGNPDERIFEDPLRILRVVRFATKFGFAIEERTAASIQKNVFRLVAGGPVSRERVCDEFTRTLTLPKAAEGVRLYYDLGILQFLEPAFAEAGTVRHDNRGAHHGETVMEHSIEVITRIIDIYTKTHEQINQRTLLILVLAALLHDIGKPAKYAVNDGKTQFIDHEGPSAEIAKKFLGRTNEDEETETNQGLMYSNDIVAAVVTLIKFHMRLHKLSKEGVHAKRRNTARVYLDLHEDDELMEMLIILGEADANQPYAEFWRIFGEYAASPKYVNGLDVIEADSALLGTPAIHYVLETIREQQLYQHLDESKTRLLIKSKIHEAKERGLDRKTHRTRKPEVRA